MSSTHIPDAVWKKRIEWETGTKKLKEEIIGAGEGENAENEI